MKQSEIIKFYSRKDVAAFIAQVAEGREVAIMLQGGNFGTRPQIIQFPQDIISFARDGATSFHISQERWKDPMKFAEELSATDIKKLRIGWDFIIDIDCPDFEISTLAAKSIIEFMKQYGIKAQIKFSGNKGWHICVPFEAFPPGSENDFPEMSDVLMKYIISEGKSIFENKLKKISFDLNDFLLRHNMERIKYSKEDIIDIPKLLGLDVQLASPRHLIRSPYSVNEKSGLISVVIDTKQISKFKKEDALPENIKEINSNFMNREDFSGNEMTSLITDALDWNFKRKKIEKSSVPTNRKFVEFKERVPEEFFPPCITKILNGLVDGRKRALFILLNFLQKAKWTWPEIEFRIQEWNKKNAEPIKRGYIISQINWHKAQSKSSLPPNCSLEQYYKDIGVCEPDELCKGIKNPISYPKRKRRRMGKQ